jgi:hypothetical protein
MIVTEFVENESNIHVYCAVYILSMNVSVF